jgi:hypothetical protein
MTEAAPRHIDGQRSNDRNDRLESWKEIAAYLGRGVRTVQRWEQAEELPIHRHHHGKRGTVYAFRHEIDRWRENRAESARSAADGDALSAAGNNRFKFASVVEWVSARLRRFVPTHVKKRLPVRMTAWILLVLG